PIWKPMNELFEAMGGRTAGFSTVDFSEAHSATLYIWVAAMMIGGAPGSTAGGIKLATLAVIILAVISTLRGQTEPQAFGRRIGVTVIFRALAIAVLFLLTRSEEHTSELQSRENLVCRLLLEKKKNKPDRADTNDSP